MPIKGNLRKHIIRKIRDMKCGESGFMSIEALSITLEDDKFRVFLNVGEYYSQVEDIQYPLPIKRIGWKDKDYEVDLRKSEDRLPIEDKPFSEWFDEGEEYKLEYVELDYHENSLKDKTKTCSLRRAKLGKLEEKLRKAINDENYELAATLRDKLLARRDKSKD